MIYHTGIMDAACRLVRHRPSIRLGQAVFMVAYLRYPKIAEKLAGNKLDPYHDDSKIVKFLKEFGE